MDFSVSTNQTTPASKQAAKAATVPETPGRDSKPSPKKTVIPKKEKRMLVRKLQPKEHQGVKIRGSD